MNAKRKAVKQAGAQTLTVAADPKDETKIITQMAADPVVRNASTAEHFGRQFGELDLRESITTLRKQTAAIHNGDLKHAETTLTAQASTLDAMFTYLARRAVNMESLAQLDCFMRHALRAQAQCRATLETLAAIKNPPNVAFVKQANIANGPQQVNNGEAAPLARTEQNTDTQNKLLESPHEKPQWMDAATPGATSRPDSPVAAVAKIERP